MQDVLWYAVRIAPCKEAAAHQRLTEQRFVSLFAHFKREQPTRGRRGRSTRIVVEPILTGYALIAHDGSPDWWSRLLQLEWRRSPTRLVKAIVGMGREPTPIPAAAIEHLMAMSGSLQAIPAAPRLSPGMRARLTDDAWRDYPVTVEAVTDNRVRVLLKLLGSERVVETTADKLEMV
jgi:transcription antitermination factor NusG